MQTLKQMVGKLDGSQNLPLCIKDIIQAFIKSQGHLDSRASGCCGSL